MPSSNNNLRCAHCSQPLQTLALPDDSGWGQATHFACFNDECSYYVDGWTWMQERYGARASYRYRITDPAKPFDSPLPVWSNTAMRDLIVND